MRILSRGFLVLAAITCASAPALATTYYVSPTGKDANTGTSADSAFLTISHAATVTAAGDTVNVMTGTYGNPCTGCDVVDITRSGTAAGGYITYQAAAGQHPVIAFSGSYQAFNVQASYIAIIGFEVHGLDQASLTLAQATALGESSPLTNNTGINVGTSSLVTPWHHITIKNNIVHGCSEAGIDVERSDYVTIENNTTYDNSNWSPYGGSGISVGYLADSDANTGYKNLVAGNVSYDNEMLVGEPAAGGTMADGNGIIIDDNENDQNGHPAYNGRTLVVNNLTYMNGGTGIHTFHSQHVDIIYNTAYMNNQSADNANGQISGIFVNDVNILNNVLYGVGNAKAISAVATNTMFTFNDNILYNGKVSFSGPDDVVGDPKFVAAGTDFHLAAGSPAIDSASTAFVTATDLDGNARPVGAGDDRGCYEYGSTAASTGCAPGTASATGQAPCTACAADTYAPAAGATTCMVCGGCDDQDACTADACDPIMGCVHEAMQCDGSGSGDPASAPPHDGGCSAGAQPPAALAALVLALIAFRTRRRPRALRCRRRALG